MANCLQSIGVGEPKFIQGEKKAIIKWWYCY